MNDVINWSPGLTLEAVEKEVILRAFRHYRGNKTITSNALGISIRTLDSKLEKYELDGKQAKASDDERSNERLAFLARQRGSFGTEAAQGSQMLHGAPTGIPMESVANTSEKQAVPVSERAKVQVVLPKQAPEGNPRKAR